MLGTYTCRLCRAECAAPRPRAALTEEARLPVLALGKSMTLLAVA